MAVVAAVALLGAFVDWQLRAEEPLLPLDLFLDRNFAASNGATFLTYAALGAYLLFLPVFLQFLGFTPFQSGLAMMPTSVALILLASRFGSSADRRGPRLVLCAGPALVGVGILRLLPIDEQADFWVWGMAALLVFSVGLSMLVAPITNTAIISAPEELAGTASGVNQTVARVGGLLAVAVVGLAIALVFEARSDTPGAEAFATRRTSPELHDATVAGFRAGMLLAAGLAFGGAAVGGLAISNTEALPRRQRASGEGALET